MTEQELEFKMKQILEDHKGLIVEADFNVVADKQIEEIKEEETTQSD